jgi:glycosyltransferase involved in cell wall biosynthesis
MRLGAQRIVRGVTVALVTNYLPAYRIPLYTLLAERLGVEVYCFGGEGHYVPEAMRDLERQLESAPFAAHRLERERDAADLGAGHEAVIASTAGRVALPSAYRGARRAGRPFLLWASLWRHPRTAAHLLSFPLMRRFYRQADAVLTYGPHVSRYVAGYRGGEAGVFAAAQAVEPELFARPVSQPEIEQWRGEAGVGEGPLVLFAGRLVPDKGVDVLARAWRRLGAGTGASLCLVGDGPLASDRSIAGVPGMTVAGPLPRERLPVAYAAADVVVVPSIATRRFLEPWGLVCNEAMSQGRPVIATDAVGAAAGGLVRDGETGLVVPAGNEGALAAALERLLADSRLRADLGRRARKAVGAYSYERAAAGFAAALEFARRR